MDLEVIYEDNHIIAINKRSGMIVQSDPSGDMPMDEMVKLYIKEKYNKPGAVFCGIVHRIDRPVSGVVLFAKTSKAQERLNEMFKHREMNKTYWALVKNNPPKTQDTLIHYLIKDRTKNITKAFEKDGKDRLESELSYKVIGQTDSFKLLEVKPVTGRPHQIRVQLASIGCPIRGDRKYGFQRANPDLSINLHARKIEFIHPVKKEPISIEAPFPPFSFWKEIEHSIQFY
jgi:23S rRNA pseudouridine1911/1915/1917 synthase